MVLATTVPFVRKQKFSRSSPGGFLLHLFSQNWICRAPLDIKGVDKVETGFNAAMENTEGLLARKRWRQ